MSGGQRCFYEDGPIDLGEVAYKYDDAHCQGCANVYDCKTLFEGKVEKPIEEADFRHNEKVDSEGPGAS